MRTFRVMTYNILNGGVGRETLIRDIVSAIHPDVAVFTEVTSVDSFEVIADAVGQHQAAASRSNRARPAIVSRWPIIQSALHGPPWSPRKWVEATLLPFGGPAVTVHGVHLVPQPLWPFEVWRRCEVRCLLKRLRTRQGTPQIIAGDFNAIMVGDGLRRETAPLWVRAQWALQGGWPRWALRGLTRAGYADCYRACHAQDPGFTVLAWAPGARLDYVFASPDLKETLRESGTFAPGTAGSDPLTPRRSIGELLGWTTVRSLGPHASDHLPVWADFQWP